MLLPLVSALALAAGPVTMQFDGPLKAGLQELAQRGGLNVVVVGDLPEPVQVHLTDARAEVALETVAQAYGLEVSRSAHEGAGQVWVLRRRGATAPEAPPVEPVAPSVSAPPSPGAPAEPPRATPETASAPERHRVGAGGPVVIERGQRVDTAVAYGGEVVVEEDAVVDEDAVAFGGDVVLKRGALVKGDAVSFGGQVVKEEGAEVRGDTVAFVASGLGASVMKGVAKTHGRVQEEVAEEEANEARGFGARLAFFLVQFAVLFGLGFVVMMLFPQRMKTLEATVGAEPGKSGVIGLLGLLASGPLTLLLVVTIIGIPVAMLLWAAVALVVPVGLAAVASAVGARLPTGRVRKTQAVVLAVGLLALLLVSRVPVLGSLALGVAVLVSLGAIIRTRFGQPPRGTPVLDPLQPAAV